MAIRDIKELRILPPLAIAHLGSSPGPMDNYDVGSGPGTGYRPLTPAPTLRVDRATGQITARTTPARVIFRDAQGKIRPIAPFLEVWARFEDEAPFQRLTSAHLNDLGLVPGDVRWRVHVANLKAFRRTGKDEDKIDADTDLFSDHAVKALNGRSTNFKPGKSLPLGSAQYIQPTADFPEIRLRFTPAAGKVYGPTAGDPNVVDDVYDGDRGGWSHHFDGDPTAPPITVPGNIYAGQLNSQTQQYVSKGYLDDACDGLVEVQLTLGTKVLTAFARVSSGPPDFAPDSFPPRTVADDLEQMLLGPMATDPVPLAEVAEIVRRALETVRNINTKVMNGNQGVGGVATNRNNMAGQDSGAGRAFEPIFDPMTVEDFDVRGIHESVLQGLEEGSPPFFLDLVRSFDQVGDLSDAGRREMPGMMRGSDGLHLALTRRQRDKIRAAATPRAGTEATPEQNMIKLIEHFQARSVLHNHIDVGGGRTLADLFADPPALLDYLKTGVAKGSLAGSVRGMPLVIPHDPGRSAYVALLNRPGHPMFVPFHNTEIPGTGKKAIQIVEDWIASL